MFDSILDNYTGPEYKIEILEGAKPYHAKPFPIPKIQNDTFETEVNISRKIGSLEC